MIYNGVKMTLRLPRQNNHNGTCARINFIQRHLEKESGKENIADDYKKIMTCPRILELCKNKGFQGFPPSPTQTQNRKIRSIARN